MAAAYDIFESASWPLTKPAPAPFLAYIRPTIPPQHLLSPEQVAPYRGPYRSRMQEWSHLKATAKTEDKFLARDLNIVHQRFVDSELDLSGYVLKLMEYLSRDFAETEVSEFLSTHAVGIETGTFRPTHGKFSKFLDATWDSWCDRHGVARLPPDPDALPFVPEDRVRVVRATKANIVQAYIDYDAKVEGADERLWQIVLTFGGMKGKTDWSVIGAMHDSFVDVAQETAIAVWQRVPDYKGTPEGFYWYLCQTYKNMAADSFTANLRISKERVPLMVEDEEDSTFLTDNPALYTEEKTDYARPLPESIQGDDELLCDYIREGMDYKLIALALDITETAVKARVRRMKEETERLKSN
jgi:DNA-directed RNA polymerase specialized sigma24 family protein